MNRRACLALALTLVACQDSSTADETGSTDESSTSTSGETSEGSSESGSSESGDGDTESGDGDGETGDGDAGDGDGDGDGDSTTGDGDGDGGTGDGDGDGGTGDGDGDGGTGDGDGGGDGDGDGDGDADVEPITVTLSCWNDNFEIANLPFLFGNADGSPRFDTTTDAGGQAICSDCAAGSMITYVNTQDPPKIDPGSLAAFPTPTPAGGDPMANVELTTIIGLNPGDDVSIDICGRDFNGVFDTWDYEITLPSTAHPGANTYRWNTSGGFGAAQLGSTQNGSAGADSRHLTTGGDILVGSTAGDGDVLLSASIMTFTGDSMATTQLTLPDYDGNPQLTALTLSNGGSSEITLENVSYEEGVDGARINLGGDLSNVAVPAGEQNIQNFLRMPFGSGTEGVVYLADNDGNSRRRHEAMVAPTGALSVDLVNDMPPQFTSATGPANLDGTISWTATGSLENMTVVEARACEMVALPEIGGCWNIYMAGSSATSIDLPELTSSFDNRAPDFGNAAGTTTVKLDARLYDWTDLPTMLSEGLELNDFGGGVIGDEPKTGTWVSDWTFWDVN